jgi:heme oxygenase
VRVREVLRRSTAVEHGRVDDIFSRFDLGRRHSYGWFLEAQAAALIPTEDALDRLGAADVLPDWPQRRRSNLLKADLVELSITVPEPFDPLPLSSDKASLLGAIYVLEGSRLGGALLKRAVADGLPQRFLDARQDAGSWRTLLKSLDEFLIRPNEVDAAVVAARCTFACFERAGVRYLEAEPSE